ncbi:sigma-70 family RNA polymerase sigma factor [Ktedonospora formicarum]|uniref:DNA-directed RNA polymerase sigma-70 factor n=1 Tax=Ktedonospora formicarum TaxID=2778364 RepID=A0A8J3MVR4_9CHLR|nr:sigma-70 family RNA polymerase sigma factor [Ktedonospora formicarum]GHO48206.1 DNA-directed RNA polymerase sigma-70 factor [Ktedonospora formicarum]
MDEHNWLVERFEIERPQLQAIAYRMLGSLPEAEDAVQESWLHLIRADRSSIKNPGAWLTRTVSRICLDMLRTRKVRSEQPLEASAPEFITTEAGGIDPEEEAELADSIGLALLVVLDRLSPAERLAFVLHDLFAIPFDEIALMLERSETATRQLASRARRRVRGEPTASDVDFIRSREVVSAFLAASREGSFDALLSVLDPDVMIRTDSVAVSRGAAKEISGAQAVARAFKRLLERTQFAQLVLVDGAVGIVIADPVDPRGWFLFLLRLTIRDGKIITIDMVADPARLHQLRLTVLPD